MQSGFEKFQHKFCRPAEGKALIVGSKVYGNKLDRRALYPDAVGVDQFEGEGVDLIADMENPPDLGKFAHVDCCSVLEHVKHPWKMAQAIEDLLLPGGSLLVLVPFIWRVHAYPDDYWRMTPSALDVLFPSVEWKVKKFVTEYRMVKRIPKREPGKWMQRAEVAAFGIKCG